MAQTQDTSLAVFAVGLWWLTVSFFLGSTSLAQLNNTRIAFVSDRDFAWNTDIYLMNSNGKQIRRLTETPKNDDHPSWSPDGQKNHLRVVSGFEKKT